jgi:Tol biopolymer transport system component/DNA-binding winged helix-turn-helix (wHTH) protein
MALPSSTRPDAGSSRHTYRFASFELDAEDRRLSQDGTRVAITARAFDVLLVLVEHRGSLVTKEELMRRVWAGAIVEDANLSVAVSAVRRVIGRDVVETVPKHGYRFTAPVEVLDGAVNHNAAASSSTTALNLRWAALVCLVAIPLAWAAARQPRRHDASAPLSRSGPEPQRLTATYASETHVSWSSRGRLVFTREGDGNADIYTADADGGRVTRLTDHPGRDEDPVWSPDGQRIAFASDRSGGAFQIYVMNADGSAPRRVTALPISCSEPSWSPDGRRLAFLRNDQPDIGQDIYTVAANGSALRRVTTHRMSDVNPAWSADGRWIAFASNRDGDRNNFEIYVVNAKGGRPRRLTFDSAIDAQPAWAPDGDQIVFASNRSGGDPAVYLMGVDGAGARRLSSGAGAHPTWSPDGSEVVYSSTQLGNAELLRQPVEAPLALSPHAGRDAFAAWSPDGRRLAFASNRSGLLALFMADESDGRVSRRTDGRANDWFPSWSPDGRRLVFQSDRAGTGVLDLCILDLHTRTTRCITSGPGIKGSPAWSPKGSEIAFQSNMGGGPYNFQIYAIAPDGSGLRRLTANTAYEGDPAWSPDGLRLAFASDRIEGQFDVYTMNHDGTGTRRLTSSPARDVNPWWAPDGRRLVFASNRLTGSDRHDLYLMSGEGSSPVRITGRGGQWPRWHPRGDRIVFTSTRHGNEDVFLLTLPPELRTTPPAAPFGARAPVE